MVMNDEDVTSAIEAFFVASGSMNGKLKHADALSSLTFGQDDTAALVTLISVLRPDIHKNVHKDRVIEAVLALSDDDKEAAFEVLMGAIAGMNQTSGNTSTFPSHLCNRHPNKLENIQ